MEVDKTGRGIRSACRFGPWQQRGYPATNKTLHTTCALMLLQTEFAVGLLAKTPGFVLEELLLCHSSCAGEGRGFALQSICSSCLAASKEILGEMGAKGGSEAGPKEKGEGI